MTVTALRASSTLSVSDRIRRLQVEARGLAREQTGALVTTIAETIRLAEEIAAGGDAYPAGIRDLARRLAEDLGQKSETIQAIAGRV